MFSSKASPFMFPALCGSCRCLLWRVPSLWGLPVYLQCGFQLPLVAPGPCPSILCVSVGSGLASVLCIWRVLRRRPLTPVSSPLCRLVPEGMGSRYHPSVCCQMALPTPAASAPHQCPRLLPG